jgi:hypothetical protein
VLFNGRVRITEVDLDNIALLVLRIHTELLWTFRGSERLIEGYSPALILRRVRLIGLSTIRLNKVKDILNVNLCF